ncbi:MAG: hypothetical protein J2P50_18365 [Hyphomicrobiaceae bacterium]|nr:hypothetical protein [Hyphomicrobiaceae bacterium]
MNTIDRATALLTVINKELLAREKPRDRLLLAAECLRVLRLVMPPPTDVAPTVGAKSGVLADLQRGRHD